MAESHTPLPAPSDTRRPFTFDRVVRILFSTAAICGIVWLIGRLSSVLLPFLVAWLIAYMLEPFVQRNKQIFKFKRRLMPCLITLLETLIIFTALGIIFVPSIISEMHQVAAMIRQYGSSTSQVPFISPAVHDFLREHIDFNRISDEMTSQDLKSIFEVIMNFVSGGVNFIVSVVSWLLVILYVIFIMLDYDNLLIGFKRMVPPRWRRSAFSIGNDIKNSMNHYFRGQALVALCVGILFSIGFIIVGLPMAVVLGLFIGLLNMVPYLQLISIPITSLLCLVCSVQDDIAFWPLWWQCMAVYIVVQCIQDLILTPKIMGKAMGLNPALILLSLSVWGSLLGFIGLIIALPLTTLVLAYYNQYIINRHNGESPAQKRSDAQALADIVKDPLK